MTRLRKDETYPPGMGSRIEIAGSSGRTYDFTALPEGVVPPFQGATLVFAEKRRGDWRVLDVRQTDYLPRGDWRPILEQIRAERPNARLLYRLNISHRVREAETLDIGGLHLAARAEAA